MAKRFKKAQITIRVDPKKGDGGSTREIEARVRGGLAYHKSSGKKSGWWITHIASGMTINPYSHAGFGSPQEAQDYIQFALGLDADWESDLDWKTWWPSPDPPPPLDTIRQKWTAWWDEECQRRRKQEDEKAEEEESNPIFELFGG